MHTECLPEGGSTLFTSNASSRRSYSVNSGPPTRRERPTELRSGAEGVGDRTMSSMPAKLEKHLRQPSPTIHVNATDAVASLPVSTFVKYSLPLIPPAFNRNVYMVWTPFIHTVTPHRRGARLDVPPTRVMPYNAGFHRSQ
jgi:hypothetical protein